MSDEIVARYHSMLEASNAENLYLKDMVCKLQAEINSIRIMNAGLMSLLEKTWKDCIKSDE